MTRPPVDLVTIVTTAPGTGPFQLGPAATAFRGIEALTDGVQYSYAVQQDNNYECGYGTYVHATRTLTRTVLQSSYGAPTPVPFKVGALVTFTLLAEDLTFPNYDPRVPINSWGLQWSPWFASTPVAGELLAMYVSPIVYQYQPNFLGSAVAKPITNPTASFVMTVQQQVGGVGLWTTIGTITIATDGTISLSTVATGVTPIGIGDRLRVLAPTPADTTVAGFAITLKGYLP